jgi:hypothetical protein
MVYIIHNKKETNTKIKINFFCHFLFMYHMVLPKVPYLYPLMFNIFLNYINSVLRIEKLNSLVDDCKFVGVITSIEDSELLKLYIDAVVDWCSNNKINLNILKCNIISFYRKKIPIVFSYHVNNITFTYCYKSYKRI